MSKNIKSTLVDKYNSLNNKLNNKIIKIVLKSILYTKEILGNKDFERIGQKLK